MDDRITITKSTISGVDIFHFEGEIDHFSIDRAEKYFEKKGVYRSRVVFDLRKLSYLSSACSRLFLPILKETRSKGGDLKICGLKGKCLEVFEILGLVNFVECVFRLPSEAVKAFDTPLKPELVAMFKEGYFSKGKGKTFHLPVCRYVLKQSGEDLIHYKHLEGALRSSKEPCKVCKPV
ncbi:MAG: STAS domain-containing protein [Planctomycetota bacterium]